MYDTPNPVLLFILDVSISPSFLSYARKELPRLPQTMVDSLFNKFMLSNFPNYIQIFTDGSVLPN